MMKYRSQKLAKALGLIVFSGLSGLSIAQTFNWSQAGPVYNAGRSRNLVVDKRDATFNTLYTGSASSGVYKSTDGGANWAPISKLDNPRNISYMAQAIDNIIYVSTGEGFLRSGQKLKAQTGTGLYKINGTNDTLGLDPVASSTMVGTVINRIACHPTKANVIALATNNGIMLSNDNGVNFVLASGITTGTNISGQDVKFDGNGILYCSVGNETSGTAPTKIYKSSGDASNLSVSFNTITPTHPVINASDYGRIELAVAPSNNNVIYASVAGKANSPVGTSSALNGLFVTYDGGSTWGLVLQGSPQLNPLSNGANVSSGDYAHVVVVNPTNPNEIFIGGYKFYLFSRTGGTDANPIGAWVNIGSSSPAFLNTPYYLHENIHDIKIVGTSNANVKFYFVTDAGIYRSTDMANATIFVGASFQPFYQGLVTGQFNSVSIESFPSSNSATVASGGFVSANDGFIGGTGGNGLTYFSGKYPLAAQETNYLSGEVYGVEYSKILSNAAFVTVGKDNNGTLYRSSDIRTSSPAALSVNSYSGTLSQITPIPSTFLNNASNNSGTPFKLWENYGQLSTATPDSLIFYNDSSRVITSIVGGVQALTTQTTFTFLPGRPNKFALIDSIAIRTGTVVYDLNATKVPTPFSASDKKDIFIKLPNNYATPTATTIVPIGQVVGPASAAGVTLNATNGLDNISVTFSAPPFANKTSTSSSVDYAVYYKVFATIFYKYKANDTITINDNSISTKPQRYSFTLSKPLRWAYSGVNNSKPYSDPTNPPQKIATRISARLAMVYSGGPPSTGSQTAAIVVSKSPLNLNDPLSFVRVSCHGAPTTDANGQPTNSVVTVNGKPILLEWSKSGSELYYATDDNKLYRVSNLYTIMDNTPSSYSGKLSTDIFKYNSALPSSPLVSTTLNPSSPYRTTLLGSFTRPITSISVAKGDTTMVLTFSNTVSDSVVMYSAGNIRKKDFSNLVFATKKGDQNVDNLANLTVYCSMIEKDDGKQVFVGTDKGMYYTGDISANPPVWKNINNKQLPIVQVFDIKQQTLGQWESYNSGQIYVATNGRGVWTNKKYLNPYIVSVNEMEKPKVDNNHLSIYPNPTNGNVYISFNSLGETASVQVLDINGRIVKSEPLGKLYQGEATYIMSTTELSEGIYIVNVTSDASVKRVAKLIVTK